MIIYKSIVITDIHFNCRMIFQIQMVADGKYHMVELLAIKKNFTLRVDRGLARSIINEGSKDFLKLSTPLFLGGLPMESGQQAYKNWHLRNLTSFKGCMKEVWINHKQVDFGNAARQQKVTPGCALLDSDMESNEQEEIDVMQETQHVLREEVCLMTSLVLVSSKSSRIYSNV